ncbi:MAG TPA: thioredoxin domain-containing protein [Gaiellales bacterium]|nr:thioredoxin domain-containing protein [Gaiellales bacterium]
MNRLAGETSPYLLQHADNPVDWYPWGEAALERARRENRPILLSIGYAACHWCHVMEHESFEDPETAELMNSLFVNIKVDREQRPDLDAIYMNAVVAFTQGHGGWPMTVFLTPEGEPFHGGTYYPPQPRMGMPAFRQVLEATAEAYRERPDDVARVAESVTGYLRSAGRLEPTDEELRPQLLEEATRVLERGVDRTWGGFGTAPKFPPASAVEFLLRMSRRGVGDDPLGAATLTLDGMALGGMYDVLGGGFARYSVDAAWLVPHFEKMLYDNALLAGCYLHGWAVTGDARYREVCQRTIDFMLRELAVDGGGFASALDADTDGEEGLTYVWTPDQVRAALGREDAEAAIAHLGVTDGGNFEGATVLRPQGEPPAQWPRIRDQLLAARMRRPQPARDDKVVASWNGLALSALAEAGRRLRRAEYLDAARRCAGFLLTGMRGPDGRLRRTAMNGRASEITAYLDDYGAVSLGLLGLYRATGEQRWLREAEALVAIVREQFTDRELGGFYYTPADGERLIARHKELDDNPTPSGQSLMATVLLQLARLHGDDALESEAAGVLRLAAPYMERSPHGLGQALCALDMYLSPPQEIAIVGPGGNPSTEALADVVADSYLPNAVVAYGGRPDDPPLPVLEGKGLVDGCPAAYVCERFACRAPVTDPDALAASLRA